MAVSRKTPALVAILFAILLVAGCTVSSPARVGPAGANITPATPVTIQCPETGNGSFAPGAGEPFIMISPPVPHRLGEVVTFDGTTNLPPGAAVQLQVISGDFVPCPKSTAGCEGLVRPCCGGFGDTVPVIAGPCGINTWSWDVNTSQHGFQAVDNYILIASTGNGTMENTRVFTLTHPGPYLVLNLPGYDPAAQIIRLDGMLENDNGSKDQLFIAVSSDSGKDVRAVIPVQHNATGWYWNYSFKKSAITPFNFYSVTVTSPADPAIRISRTFAYDNEPAYYPYNPVGP